jgi:predicted dehydrogenase
MYTILGSGFGIYGYLPAVIRHMGEELVLPMSYRAAIRSRPELRDCVEKVRYVSDREVALNTADQLIVALPPVAQAELINEIAGISTLRTIVLEKPVAPTPEASLGVHNILHAANKRVLVNYSFLYTGWHDRLVQFMASASPNDQISIDWRFRAHHFERRLGGWKTRANEGGGPVRFFGIHLIAVLAHFGYTEVSASRVEACGSDALTKWTATFAKTDGPEVAVTVDTNSDRSRFALHSTIPDANRLSVELTDVFAGQTPLLHPGEDRRVAVIARMLRSERPDAESELLYRKVISLWDRVERSGRPVADCREA